MLKCEGSILIQVYSLKSRFEMIRTVNVSMKSHPCKLDQLIKPKKVTAALLV